MLRYFLSIHILPVLFIFSSWAYAGNSYSQVFIFGDSLSDTGNLATVIGDFPPPYIMNRASNGPVAVDTFTAELGYTANASLHLIGPEAGGNYAVAGANASGEDLIDLNTQIMSFHANHGFVAPSDALYVIFIGGNDVRAARDVAELSAAKLIVKAAANEVRQAILSLSSAGARTFMLVNSANVGLIPETQLIAHATSNPDLIERTGKLSKGYRRALHDIAGNIAEHLEEEKNIDIIEFDFFKFFNKLVKKADTYGFSNSTDACFSSKTFSFHPDCNFGFNFDQFIFFDETHPTARAHALIGEAMHEALDEDND